MVGLLVGWCWLWLWLWLVGLLVGWLVLACVGLCWLGVVWIVWIVLLFVVVESLCYSKRIIIVRGADLSECFVHFRR